MTKLKTLNNICWKGFGNNPSEFANEETRLIRQEAIKWIKEYDNGINGQAVQEFIKHFFNIQSEEIK